MYSQDHLLLLLILSLPLSLCNDELMLLLDVVHVSPAQHGKDIQVNKMTDYSSRMTGECCSEKGQDHILSSPLFQAI